MFAHSELLLPNAISHANLNLLGLKGATRQKWGAKASEAVLGLLMFSADMRSPHLVIVVVVAKPVPDEIRDWLGPKGKTANVLSFFSVTDERPRNSARSLLRRSQK